MSTKGRAPDDVETTPVGALPSALELHIALSGSVNVVAIPRTARITIGRSSAAEVQIDDGSVSRRHVTLDLDSRILVTDLGSQNGTQVRGVRIAPHAPVEVGPGESFQVGLATVAVHSSGVGASTGILKQELRAHEREHIRAALERCGGNQTKAARLLGISRRTLVSRLAQYALPRPRKT